MLAEIAAPSEEDEQTDGRTPRCEGIADLRIRHAVERHETGEVSTNEAARIAAVSAAEWLEIARERGLTTQLSPDALESDVRSARDI
ncbi:hypothetical protein [Natrarchaeobius halalkaliphilus]|uniref:hypothetical protein n=1 Tax=Natrarchaeobius halalkaliphilus TaxID=1679091 RepID=UPI003743FD44